MCSEAEYPQYLLPDEKKYNGKDGKIDFRALTDKETLQRHVAKLSDDLHHPVSILDVRQEKTVETEDTSSSRADSSIRTACNLLRKCAGSKYCEVCDKFHAKCMGADEEETKRKIQESIRKPEEFFYKGYKDHPPQVHTIRERPVIEYHCPMLGYRELIFPVQFGANVIGVLFAGQIIVSSEYDMERNKKIREEFFEQQKPERLFKSFVEAYNRYHEDDQIESGDIQKRIMEVDEDTDLFVRLLNFNPTAKTDKKRYYFKNFESMEEFVLFKVNVCNSIARLERDLYEEYARRRKKHFERVIRGITEEFMEQYRKAISERRNNAHDQRAAELKAVWIALQDVSKKIKIHFSYIESVTVFGDGETLTIQDIRVKKAQYSTAGNIDGQTLDFSKAKKVESTGYETSINNPLLLLCLRPEEKRENRIVIQCLDIAMALELGSLSNHTTLYGVLADTIGSFLTRINSVIALCTANLTKEKHLLTLRMNRHENAHISARLRDTMDRYFGEDGQRFIGLKREKRELVVNDVHKTIWLISCISDNLGVVTGSINENSPWVKAKTTVDVINMQYKWQNMFHDKLIDRSLDFVIPSNEDGGQIGQKLSCRVNDDVATILDDTRLFIKGNRIIWIQKDLFELLVYNLVDNAVKYAYQGTNIYLIWRSIDDCRELSVVNYGPPIEEGDKPYELYYHGDAQGTYVEGDGLGLYVVRRISLLIGVECSHSCKKLSNYNIPLISWYKERQAGGEQDFQNIEAWKLDDYDKTLDRIVINQYEETRLKRVTKARLIKRIKAPTYRTIFFCENKEKVIQRRRGDNNNE